MIDSTFLFSGNAIFTVSNPDGKYYTYKVVKSKNKNLGGLYTFFVSTLTGPDCYTYLGIIKDFGVRLTAKSKYKKDTKVYRVADWAIRCVTLYEKVQDGYKIDRVGKCGKCGRKLTTPESIQLGLGPICRNIT